MKIANRLVAAVLGVLLVVFGPFQSQALDQKFPPLLVPQIKFERYKLANGLEVILSEDHRLPIVSVNLWYHVGAVNETVGRTGFAHLFEHMMFEGSKHVPGNSHFRYLEAAGASWSGCVPRSRRIRQSSANLPGPKSRMITAATRNV